MDEKLITAGIPVYNGEKFIAQTLESIINQTYKNLEIIVSDNGSNDTTVEIVKEFMKRDSRISLNQNLENLGYSGNLNKIIELASSEYIAIYHADDVYESTIVEEQVKFLDENKELAGCFTLGKMIDENGKEIKNRFPFVEKNTKENLIMDLDTFIENILKYGGSTLICPTSIIKKSVYNELGGYNINLKYIEDQDMWIRILEKGKLGIVAKELINYRVHNMQGSAYYSCLQREELSVHLQHVMNTLGYNYILRMKFEKELKKSIAKDYLNIVKNKFFLNEKEKINFFIEESKKNHKFFILTKSWLLQNMNCLIIRWGVTIVFKIVSNIKKVR